MSRRVMSCWGGSVTIVMNLIRHRAAPCNGSPPDFHEIVRTGAANVRVAQAPYQPPTRQRGSGPKNPRRRVGLVSDRCGPHVGDPSDKRSWRRRRGRSGLAVRGGREEAPPCTATTRQGQAGGIRGADRGLMPRARLFQSGQGADAPRSPFLDHDLGFRADGGHGPGVAGLRGFVDRCRLGSPRGRRAVEIQVEDPPELIDVVGPADIFRHTHAIQAWWPDRCDIDRR